MHNAELGEDPIVETSYYGVATDLSRHHSFMD